MYLCFPLAIFSIHSVLTVLAITRPNITSDQNALRALKDHITFHPDQVLERNWSIGSSVCEWIGVTCGSRHHRVTALNLSSMGLTGTIPSQLRNLSFLVSLDLSRNNFHGNLPNDLAHLRRLRVLDISVNNLAGEFPLWLSSLHSLQVLALMNNSFTGPIPSSLFSNISNLETLRLSFNPLKGRIPVEIGNLHNLKKLSINFCQLSGILPVEIFNISSLEMISLAGNNLSGTLPSNMCGHLGSRLKRLSLVSNNINGPIPSSLSQCTELQILAFTYNNFSGSIPKEIGNLKVLEELYLGGNQLEGGISKEIGNLTQLRELVLENNYLTGVIPQELGKLCRLEVLVLGSNILSGSIPTEIFNHSEIREMSLFDNKLSGSVPMMGTLGLPNLEQISLAVNQLSGVIPYSISNSSKLRSIEISRNNFFGPIPHSLGDLQFLEFLNLEDNNLTGDSSSLKLDFITSLANCKYLSNLEIDNNPLNGILPNSVGNLSDYLVGFLANNCKIKGGIPSQISNLSSLILIDLSSNQLTGSLPTSIQLLQNLQGLFLTDAKLSGLLLDHLCTLQKLDSLYLSNNRILGQIPNCLGNVTSLRHLYLDSNRLNSHIPANLWKLRYILELNLSSNSFSGSLSPDVGNLKVATKVDLSRNHFSIDLPYTIGSLQNLEYLSLSQNELQGSIPDSIGGILSLESLYLSHNNFSGSIPRSLEKITYLRYFNVSFNNLQGEIPTGGPFKNFTYGSFIFNKELCGASRFHVPPCPTMSTQKSSRKKLHRIVYLLLGLLGIGGIVTVGAIYLICQKRDKVKNRVELLTVTTQERISYYQLQQATDSYNERNLLGVGSFGSVYKGTLHDGRMIAVKVLNLQIEGAFKSFEVECEVLRNLRHRNLTKVICSCSNLDFKALVLEFMPNGSLEMWLHTDNIFLSTRQRLNIMIDVAYALQYLHSGYLTQVVHSDLKPSNVLLDQEMVAHVSDFGISKMLGQDSIVHTNTLATFGYMAPEYGSEGLVSTKCDVYSYGIMLMEVFTRKRPSDEMFGEKLSIKDWVNDSMPNAVAEVIDYELLKVGEECYTRTVECISMIMYVALNCTKKSLEERWNIEEVLTTLNKLKLKLLSC